jgi:uncharacterized protein
MLRVVIDTNVLISGVIAPKGASARILDAWRAADIEVVMCPDILRELDEMLRLPRLRNKYALTDEFVSHLILQLGRSTLLVSGTTPVTSPPPDPDDRMLFSAAMESAADFIVTGDVALLEHSWPGTAQVISPRSLCEQHLSNQP